MKRRDEEESAQIAKEVAKGKEEKMARRFNLDDKVRVKNRPYTRGGLAGKIGKVIGLNPSIYGPFYSVEFPDVGDKVDIVINFYPQELEKEEEKER